MFKKNMLALAFLVGWCFSVNLDSVMIFQRGFFDSNKLHTPPIFESNRNSILLVLRAKEIYGKNEMIDYTNDIIKPLLVKFCGTVILEIVDSGDIYQLKSGYQWIIESHVNSKKLPFRFAFGVGETFEFSTFGDEIIDECKNQKKSDLLDKVPSIENFERYITNQGFHRVMNTKITFSSSFEGGIVILSDLLPRGVYVDEFELERSFDNGTFRIRNYNRVDIEKPKRLGEPVHIEFLKPMKDVVLISYPIHIRYHPPSSSELHSKIELSYPEVIIELSEGWSDENFVNCLFGGSERIIDSIPSFLIDSSRFVLSFKSNKNILEVPVGQTKDKNIITFLTLGVTLICTFFLVILVSIQP